MSIRWYSVVVDCHDVVALSRWWADVLDWQVAFAAKDEIVLVPRHASRPAPGIPPAERGPGLGFCCVDGVVIERFCAAGAHDFRVQCAT